MKNRDERQIDLVVQVQKALIFHVVAQCNGQSAGYVRAFGQCSAHFQIEAAQRNVGKAMRGVSGIEQIRIECGVVLDAAECDALGFQRMQRGFEIVNGFGQFFICQRADEAHARVAIVDGDCCSWRCGDRNRRSGNLRR